MGKKRSAELTAALLLALRRHSGQTVTFHAAIAERLGLGPADHKCLDLLIQHGSQTAGELAAKTGLTTGAITGVIDRLVKAGYAVRADDPTDRRRVVVRPVFEKAMAELGPVFDGVAQATTALLDRYTDAERELLLDFLTRAGEMVEGLTADLRRD